MKSRADDLEKTYLILKNQVICGQSEKKVFDDYGKRMESIKKNSVNGKQ